MNNGKVIKMRENIGGILDRQTADELMETFKKRFVISDYDPKSQKVSRLLWCSLSCEVRTMPLDELKSIQLSPDTLVYCYNERSREMCGTTFGQICEFISELEPWEETDIEIFDLSFKWFIAVTHEDFLIVYGL